jgi:hypothetical protein
LLIPLVLGDGKMSFLGVQVKFVQEKYVNKNVNDALKVMTYSNIFGSGCDRPFAMIILALGNYKNLYVQNRQLSENPNTFENPDVLVFKGIHNGPVDLFAMGPTGTMYRGIDKTYLEECDLMGDLVREIEIQSKETIAGQSTTDQTGNLEENIPMNSELPIDFEEQNISGSSSVDQTKSEIPQLIGSMEGLSVAGTSNSQQQEQPKRYKETKRGGKRGRGGSDKG